MTAQRLVLRPSTIRRLVVAGIAGCAVAVGAVGIVTSDETRTATTAVRQPTLAQPPTIQSHRGAEQLGRGYSGGFAGGFGGSADPSTGTTDAVDATAAQEIGLVYITTTLDYGTGQAAGTGMILTSDGEILTNHHVVEGATTISVEDVSTGRTYDADVVGYDATSDVAVLQLDDASGLTPVTTDADEVVQVGDAVTGVGNANGDGGAASAAAGTVAALDQTITVSSETGGEAAQLSGLIQVDADIIAGDSGGALYDDDGEVIGMNTAASSGSTDISGYAVPIASALAIADQIESGQESDTVEIGGHGFLGVELSPDVTGALVAGVVEDSPAADAGVSVGSTITSLNGTATTSADALSAAVSQLEVGDRVTLAWTDTSGQATTATITLGAGPVG
jgi:S1-C subfamily serine protease